MTDNNTLDKITTGNLYVHIYSDGRIFLLPAEFEKGSISNLKSLKLELQRTLEHGGIVFYSLEETGQNESDAYTTACDLIFDSGVETQMMHPHPQTYGYYKSFVPYLNDALELAGADVKGLLSEIHHAEEKIGYLTAGSKVFNDTLLELEVLKGRYIIAQNCLDKLSTLHFHLCVRTELEES